MATANAIKVTAAIEIANGTFRLPKYGATILQIDQNNVGGGIPGIVTVPVADTVIDLSALGTFGWAYFQNVDGTNYVRWGPTAAGVLVPMGRMLPGESAVMRIEPGIVLRMFANTSPVQVQIIVNED